MRPCCPLALLILTAIVPSVYAQKDSKNLQPMPTETTVCEIMKNPSAFNNKLVRVSGHVEVSFEYSFLEDDDCSDALWFALADGSGPPGLVAIVNGEGKPGGKSSKGVAVKPVLVRLIRDANFEKFQHYMTVKAEEKPCLNSPLEPTPVDCAVDRVTATFTGRIDSVSKQLHEAHLKRPEHNDGKGFGHMGMFDAELVAGLVENVLAVDSFARAKP